MQKTTTLALLVCTVSIEAFAAMAATSALMQPRIAAVPRSCPPDRERVNKELFKTFGYPTSEGCILTVQRGTANFSK